MRHDYEEVGADLRLPDEQTGAKVVWAAVAVLRRAFAGVWLNGG
jgi:hypothetical protein